MFLLALCYQAMCDAHCAYNCQHHNREHELPDERITKNKYWKKNYTIFEQEVINWTDTFLPPFPIIFNNFQQWKRNNGKTKLCRWQHTDRLWPHICHSHHNRWLCKNIQSSVKFSKVEGKETYLILHKMCSFTKSVLFCTNCVIPYNKYSFAQSF